MIVYLENKSKFRDDVHSNRIDDVILDKFRNSLGIAVGEAERNSWRNSLSFMDRIMNDDGIPDDVGVAIEFTIPNIGKRIDVILTGKDDSGGSTAVIIELKQWSEVQAVTSKDAMVSTWIGGRPREVSHPSYQAWSYASYLEDFNENISGKKIRLRPCAYLHNCGQPDVIRHPHYKEHTSRAPAFLRDDARKLQEFIKQFVKTGDSGRTMYHIEGGKIRPSKSLADCLSSLLNGNKEFHLIDDQKVVYENALYLAKRSSSKCKNVLIVEGGPGTGKSVVAINLLVELTKSGKVAQYVTRNSAPRIVYAAKLSGTMAQTRISSMFVGSGQFTNIDPNGIDVLIVDEAHRLNEKSGMFSNLGEDQAAEIIRGAKCAIFFIDDRQRIHWKDVGSVDRIKETARKLGANVEHLQLESQFRCNGSDGYLSWVDQLLQLRFTANPTLDGVDYEFKVCDSATELRQIIRDKNKNSNKARMVAGYCWDWISKKNPDKYDFDFNQEGFLARWNLNDDGMLWILGEKSVEQIGCIHTCQGLELDHVGVIVGGDLVVRDGVVCTDASKRSKNDASIKGYKNYLRTNPAEAKIKAEAIIKNTYRTLMTRGQKGCYVYCVDEETRDYIRKAATRSTQAKPVIEIRPHPPAPKHPFRVLDPAEVKPYVNSVPKFDFKVAAGGFSPEQAIGDYEWVELPEHFKPGKGLFVAQVSGESMNRKIPNGSWCLFQSNPAGSRNGKIVLVQHQGIHDQDYSASFTIKLYSSEKVADVAGGHEWRHSRIYLRPQSSDPGFKDIIIDENDLDDLKVVGQYVVVIEQI